jgi:phosphate transport system substrate-binding protein
MDKADLEGYARRRRDRNRRPESDADAGAVYASFSGTHGKTGIVEIGIDGNAATEENVQNGKYPFWSYEHMYTNGSPSKEVSRFIAFLQSDSTLLRKLGYILSRDIQNRKTIARAIAD